MNDAPTPHALPEIVDAALLPELRTLIADTRRSVAQNVNSALVQLYWQIGTRVHTGILAHGWAEYGKQIVAAAGRQLEQELGRGFGEKNLRRIIQLAQAFPALLSSHRKRNQGRSDDDSISQTRVRPTRQLSVPSPPDENSKPNTKIGTAYHKADKAIQRVVDLLAAACLTKCER